MQDVESPVLLDASVLTRCRHRVHLDAGVTAGKATAPPGTTDPGVRQRQEEAAAHRVAVGDTLQAAAVEAGLGWADVGLHAGRRARAAATVAAARAGVDRIWGAVLPADVAGGLRGTAELLVRRDDGYLPVLVVNHRVSDPGSGARTSPLHTWAPVLDLARTLRSHPRDQLRLAHLTRLLQACGLASAEAVGGVIGLDADCVVVHDLATSSWAGGRSTLQVHAERLADRLAVATGAVPTEPSRVGECRTCSWWPRCSAELAAAHDVSLVVRGAQVPVLREVGVRTVDELAGWAGAAPVQWPGSSFDEAVILARAWLVGAPLVRRTEQVVVRRADVEVDVDMESYLEHGAYLWGTLRTEGGVTSGYRPFVTWDPVPTRDEARSFAAFWTWLSAQRADAAARGLSFAAFCYSEAAENRWLLSSAHRFAGEPGVPGVDQVLEFISGEQWVDLFAAVRTAFLCPAGRGLKKVAPVAGFRWQDPDAGGEASMSWYRVAVGMAGGPADAGGARVQRRRLLQYNADDVWATKVLREWMSSPRVRDVPWASEL